jgi:hypothetical protein
VPLIKKRSEKAFKHNIEAEMHAGKPQKQALAIAYSVKRKAKKAAGGSVQSGSRDMNMARGGTVGDDYVSRPEEGVNRQSGPNAGQSHMGKSVRRGDLEGAKKVAYSTIKEGRQGNRRPIQGLAEGGAISASNERRPMPDNRYNDSMETRKNSGNKPAHDDSWTDKPTERQAKANDVRGKKLPIKRPRMVPTDAYSTKLYDREGNLEETASPGPYDAQPEHWEDEDGADRQGPALHDMEDEHSTHRKPYAKGGMIDDMDHPSKHDMEPEDHDIEARERSNEAHLMSMEDPSEDEGYADAMSRNEMDPDRQGHEVRDMEDEHSTGRKPYAGGGKIEDSEENIDSDVDGEEPATHGHSPDDSEDQPHDEAEEEHHNSIAAAIMARRARLHAEIDSGAHDLDSAMRMAEGGEILEDSGDILSHGSMDSDDSSQVDLRRNAEEDANEEDQASWNALRKENYDTSYWDTHQPDDSNTHGDDEEMDSHDKHDMVSLIRRKMKSKRQFKD